MYEKLNSRLARMPGFSALIVAVHLATGAQAVEDCRFDFEVKHESSAFHALVEGAQTRGGFWRPIHEAPDDVRALGKFIGRLDICMMTPDGQPRPMRMANGVTRSKSVFTTYCTAALLPGNRLLTNRHCFYDDVIRDAGFSVVREVRVNFNYVDRDLTETVETFLVDPRELAVSEDFDAMILRVFGDANGVQGGHFPMVMEAEATPRRALTMIHHPGAAPQQFSSGTCQIHERQSDVPDTSSKLRHKCESTGGSSGALLLDARTLAIVGLHNQGGLNKQGGFNGGHRIGPINEALNLGLHLREAPEDDADLSELDRLRAEIEELRKAAKKDTVLTTAARIVLADREKNSLVKRCDALAGMSSHPDFQSGKAEKAGVPLANIDFESAIAACRAAVSAFPIHARMSYNLGRAFYAAKRYEESQEAFLKSAELGDRQAMTHVGYNYRLGLGATQSDGEAFRWYEAAAELGEVAALHNLGVLYESGIGTAQSYEKAAALFQRAVDQDNADSHNALGALYELGHGVEQNYARAAELYLRGAELGVPEAMTNLGQLYEFGRGVEQSHETALDYYRRAADLGFAKAQRNVGLFYADGRVVGQSHQEALRWAEKAARQGYSYAQFDMAYAYHTGRGVAQDFAEAVKWYRLASAQGLADAQKNLGGMYAFGRGVPVNYEEALSLFHLAAEQDHAPAQYEIGRAYQNGRGVQQSDLRAALWYEKSAAKGYSYAQNALGTMYLQGKGVDKSVSEALFWFRKAADQGNLYAQYNLGSHYEAGSGVLQNSEMALSYFTDAANQGDSEAQYKVGRYYEIGLGTEMNLTTARQWYKLSAAQGFEKAKEALARLDQ